VRVSLDKFLHLKYSGSMESKTKTGYIKGTGAEVKFLKGVGETRARMLAKLGIHRVIDFMEHFPRNYISREINPALHEVQPGDHLAFSANISWVDVRPTKKGRKMVNVGVNDGHKTLVCTWFLFPSWYEKVLKPGHSVWVNGVVSEYNRQLQMLHPEVELISDEEDTDFWKARNCLPVYPLTANLTQKQMRNLIHNAFEGFAQYIEENLPQKLIDRHGFRDRNSALQMMHFGMDVDVINQTRERFVYEEFFFIQLLWARHKYYHKTQVQGIRFINKKLHTTALKHKLPFTLTGAQARVVTEIFADMCSDRQMTRLVQGDVGSGKTVVTLFAMLLAVENGYQAALMAPTEILAEQHYGTITKLLDGMDIKVCLLKGGSYKGKAQDLKDISSGHYQLIIGTHALIQDKVKYHSLGFVAVDEQHRFGVQQRASLAKKDKHPDILYLSATPIPRSLSMTVYGDLEVSIIDELPPTRKAVLTLVRSNRKIGLVWEEVRKQLKQKRQAYVVCPLVEESDKVDLLDAQRLHEHLSTQVFKEFKCELIHGRMPAAEKDEIMRRFKQGETDLLVSTTVIEVGVDVPNATVMVIEHAERFGLAQLHQLRGRVGRGAFQAYCYLIEHQPISKIAAQRLHTMVSSTDGFVIAEKDLELRGPGEFFGTEQAGLPAFRFANLITDQHILKKAKLDAFEIIENDPDLQAEEHRVLKDLIKGELHEREELIMY